MNATHSLSTFCHGLRLPVLAAMILVLAGCVKTDSTFQLNPDGSGKVEHRATFTKTAGNWTAADPGQAFAQAILRGAEGIEAWDEVFFRLNDDTIEFRGVGYFPDVNAVNLGTIREEDGDTLGTNVPRVEFREGVLQLHDSGEGDKQLFGGLLSGLNDDPEAKRMAGITGLSTSRNQVRFVTSGSFHDAEGFTLEEGAKAVEFLFDPKAWDHIQKEDLEALEPTSFYDQPAFVKLAVGAEAVKVGIDPGKKPLFDYKAEAAKAEIKIAPETEGGWRKLESLE